MVSFDQLRGIMHKPSQIRNISVIAHVDHGKSTLMDALVSKAGVFADKRAGEARLMDTRIDEKERLITIKSACVSLHYQKKDRKKQYLINLVNSPGHLDFSSEVTAALRVTDGALVLVDCIEGVRVQTETVLRQAISERIKPVLFLNKVDRIFLERPYDFEEVYQSLRNSVEMVNVIVATYKDKKLGDIDVYPDVGNVGFGSGLHGWGFTLHDFAKLYANKFGLPKGKLMKKLWGNNWFDPKTGKWVKKNRNNKLTRGFCEFVLKPLRKLMWLIANKKKKTYKMLFKLLKIELTKTELKLPRKALLNVALRKWIPVGDAVLSMIVNRLPSPVEAQKYRCAKLYTGPLDDATAQAIRMCDSKSGLSIYVSKMLPTAELGRFIALGRVFSGTVSSGQTVRILGPDYMHGQKRDLYIKNIPQTLLMMGRHTEQVSNVPAGNMVGLVGVDQYLLKSGTISTSEDTHPFKTMKFSVATVVRIAVEPKQAQDLPKVVEGLKRLSKSDPLVRCTREKTGEHIIRGAGELHLQICLKDLREQFLRGAEIKVSEPIVSYAETIAGASGSDGIHPSICTARSPNKQNCLFMKAEPLHSDLRKLIEKGDIMPTDNPRSRARRLADEFGWDTKAARKIWAFGCPPDATANLLVNTSKGVQSLNEIKEHVVSAFNNTTAAGALCEEVLRGVRANIEDATLHADAIHRGAGQIIPCARMALYACQMGSSPRMMEPVYKVNITVPISAQAGVYATINKRRGVILKVKERAGMQYIKIQAYLPVAESFGFTQMLRKRTGAQAFPRMKFSHWQIVGGDPLEEGSGANMIARAIRKRKGLRDTIHHFENYSNRW